MYAYGLSHVLQSPHLPVNGGLQRSHQVQALGLRLALKRPLTLRRPLRSWVVQPFVFMLFTFITLAVMVGAATYNGMTYALDYLMVLIALMAGWYAAWSP